MGELTNFPWKKSRKMKKIKEIKKSTLFKIIISVLLIFFLFKRVGVGNITSTLRFFNIYFLLLAALAFFANHLVAVVNLKILSSPIKNIRWSELTKDYFHSYALGMLSPGKVGEFSLTYFLKNRGITFGEGAAIVLFDKLITLLTLALIALFGFGTFFPEVGKQSILIVLAAITLFFLFVVFSSNIRIFIRKFILRKYSFYFKGFSNYFKLMITSKSYLSILNICLTLLKWVFSSLILYFILIGFNVKIPFYQIYFISSFIALVSLVPIAINGIGVKESVAIFLYGVIGVPSNVILSSYILSYVVQYSIVFIIFNLVGGKKEK